MSRPIAYNASGPLSGSIRGGSVNYTVDSGNRDYTTFASKKWVPSADGAAPIVFVTDTYTQGFELNPSLAVPLFYSCNGTGSAAIIYTANRVPSSPGNYTDANVALNDLITARGYFILESNDPFEGVDADGLALDIDASKMSSYPQTGTSWYDLSGNGFSTTLVNGPTFQTGGWFNLDGTDDRIQRTSNILTTTTGTVVMWLRTTDQTWLMIEGNTTSYYLGAIYLGGAWYNQSCGSPSYFVDTKSSTNPTSEGYIDGRFHMFEAKNVDLSGWTTHQFLDYGGGSTFNMAGDVAKIQMYNKNLTAAESKQNYFGAPIVTDGLVFAVDANNIVSYPKSGTSWYNLTGSVDGTLTNGPTFSPADGGELIFDGTDDYIDFGNPGSLFNPATSTMTMMGWIYVKNNQINILIGLQESGAGSLSLGTNSSGNVRFICRPTAGAQGTIDSSATLALNTWYHIAMTKDTANSISDCTLWINGSPVNTASSTVNFPTSTAAIRSAYYFDAQIYSNINIGSIQVYNRALTAAEVLQNYQAEQYRFDYANGSTAALAAPSAAYLYSMGVRTNGLYYINTLSGGPVQVYCDFTTLDANGESGWMLVGSWDNSNTWTLSANSLNSVFSSTPLNCVSSNFGNNPINQFRVQVASTVDSGGASAVADFYYNWSNNTIMWKEVWAPDGTLSYYYLSQGSNPAVPRASIKQFDNSYNIKGGYNNPNHKWNNISDYGLSGTAVNGVAPTGVVNAPVAGLCPFWTALTTPSNTFGVYCMGRFATFSTCTSPDVDGTLAIPTNGAGTDTTGQDVDSNVSAKYGYDDGVLWQTPSNNKMWWWIK